jgi:transposase InsO family protein
VHQPRAPDEALARDVPLKTDVPVLMVRGEAQGPKQTSGRKKPAHRHRGTKKAKKQQWCITPPAEEDPEELDLSSGLLKVERDGGSYELESVISKQISVMGQNGEDGLSLSVAEEPSCDQGDIKDAGPGVTGSPDKPSKQNPARDGNTARTQLAGDEEEERNAAEPCHRCGRWWPHGVCRHEETVYGTPVGEWNEEFDVEKALEHRRRVAEQEGAQVVPVMLVKPDMQGKHGEATTNLPRGCGVKVVCGGQPGNPIKTPLTIAGFPTLALNDTGAWVTLISHRLAKVTGLDATATSSGNKLVGPDGTPLRCFGRVWVPFVIESYTFTHQAYIVEGLMEDVIFGIDFLTMFKAGIDLQHRVVRYRGKDKENWVALARDLTIPPRHQAVAAVFTPFQEGACILLEPCSRLNGQHGLHAARCLSTVDGEGLAHIRVCNISAQPLVIPAGMPVASGEMYQAERLQVVDRAPERLGPVRQQGFQKEVDVIVGQLTHLNEEQRGQLKALLVRHGKTLFAERPGLVKDVLFDVDASGEPVRRRTRRYTQQEKDEMHEQIKYLTEQGFIEPSSSDWCAGVVLAPKKDGTLRFCVDYRELNSRTKFDAYPMPDATEALDALTGAQFFTTLDAEKGYHQVLLRPEARKFTAFATHEGLWQYRRMPFGLKNAPACFQRIMDLVLAGLLWEEVLVYIDDIIIFSKEWRSHLETLSKVLQRLEEAGLTLKLPKCHFARQELAFLGFRVSADGVRKDPAKVAAIGAMEVPTTAKQLRTFLGLTGYLRRFIKGYAEVARPLTDLLTEEARGEWAKGSAWNPLATAAFEKLKLLVAEEVVLDYPNPKTPYHVVCDASDFAVGAMLAQLDSDGRERPIAFASKRLTETESRYSATEREGLAVVFAVKKFRQHILGRPTVVVTDHAALRQLYTTKDPVGRISRWVVLLMEYNLTFVHRPGTENRIADALSRLARVGSGPETWFDTEEDEQVVQAVQVATEEKTMGDKTAWRQWQEQDSRFGAMVFYLEHGKLPDNIQEEDRNWVLASDDRFTIVDGLLHRVDFIRDGRARLMNLQVVTPSQCRDEVLQQVHSSEGDGAHPGIRRTAAKAAQAFWWPSMTADAERYVRGCLTCQRVGRQAAPKLAQRGRPVGEFPLDLVAMDVLQMPISKTGYRYILTMVDYHTRYAWAEPLFDKSAGSVVQAYMKHLVWTHGGAQRLLTDNGGEFTNGTLREVCSLLGTKKIFSTPYHPEGDGSVERMNRTILTMLRPFEAQAEGEACWDESLPKILGAYNGAPSDGLGGTTSPYEAMFGRRRPTQLERALDLDKPGLTTDAHISGLEEFRHWLNERTRSQGEAQVRRSRRTRTPPVFQPGGLVWVRCFTRAVGPAGAKLLPRYHGPFVVLLCADTWAKVRPLGAEGPVQARNLSHLRAVLTASAEPISTLPARLVLGDQTNSEEEGEEYEVEKLTDCRKLDDRIQFKIKYAGWPGWYWTDELDLSCADKVQKYFKEIGKIGEDITLPRHEPGEHEEDEEQGREEAEHDHPAVMKVSVAGMFGDVDDASDVDHASEVMFGDVNHGSDVMFGDVNHASEVKGGDVSHAGDVGGTFTTMEGEVSLTPVVLRNGVAALLPRQTVDLFKPTVDNRAASAITQKMKVDLCSWPKVMPANWRSILQAETMVWDGGSIARRPLSHYDHTQGGVSCWSLILGPGGYLTPYPATEIRLAGDQAIDYFGLTATREQAEAWRKEALRLALEQVPGDDSTDSLHKRKRAAGAEQAQPKEVQGPSPGVGRSGSDRPEGRATSGSKGDKRGDATEPMRLEAPGLATWKFPWRLPSGAIVTRHTTTTWEGHPICTQGTAPDMLGTNKGKLAFSDTEAPGRPTCKRVTWSRRDEVVEVRAGDRHRCPYLTVYEGAMWHHHGKEGGRRDKPSRGTTETITRTTISSGVTTQELRSVLNALLIRSGGTTEQTGYVMAVGNNRQRPWEDMSVRRIPAVDQEWVAHATRDIILCPSEMTGSRAIVSVGVMSSVHRLRTGWEEGARREALPEFEALKKFCVPHQYSGCLTPVLPHRDSLTRFLAQASLVLEKGMEKYENSVQLTVLMLGEVQRHPLLLADDLGRAPFIEAKKMRGQMREESLCFRTRRPDAGPQELFPIHASETAANLHAIWASMATSTFPFIGLPLATHTGEVTPWPFSPNHGSILATIAMMMEHSLQTGTAQLDIPGREQHKPEEPDQEMSIEPSHGGQARSPGPSEWAFTQQGSDVEPTA